MAIVADLVKYIFDWLFKDQYYGKNEWFLYFVAGCFLHPHTLTNSAGKYGSGYIFNTCTVSLSQLFPIVRLSLRWKCSRKNRNCMAAGLTRLDIVFNIAHCSQSPHCVFPSVQTFDSNFEHNVKFGTWSDDFRWELMVSISTNTTRKANNTTNI